jgi:pilus assembly protein Flp/PilA
MPIVQTESIMPAKSKAPRKWRKSTLRLHLLVQRRRMAKDQDGATAIEYALIASGVGAAVAATVWSLGTTTAGLYQSLANMF